MDIKEIKGLGVYNQSWEDFSKKNPSIPKLVIEVAKNIELMATEKSYVCWKKGEGVEQEAVQKVGVNVVSVKEKQPPEEGFRKTYQIEFYFSVKDPLEAGTPPSVSLYQMMIDKHLESIVMKLDETQRENVQITYEVSDNSILVSFK